MTDAGEKMLTEDELSKLCELYVSGAFSFNARSYSAFGNLLRHIAALSATIKRLETERDDALREIERWKHRPIIRREEPRPFVIDEDWT